MAKKGLKEWLDEKWVDIGAPKKMVSINHVEDKKEVNVRIQNACLLQKQNQ